MRIKFSSSKFYKEVTALWYRDIIFELWYGQFVFK